MVGDALVCFRRGTTNLLSGDVSYSKNIGFIFGIPNARMSSCPCFQHFPPLPCLDNSVSGIPNAIPRLLGGRTRCRGKRGNGRLYRSPGTPIKVHRQMVLRSATLPTS